MPFDDEERRENELFEDETRRIARQLWPEDQYAGAAKVDGAERDGVFETEECIHLLEATTSRRKDKAQIDVTKLLGLASRLQRKTTSKAVRCWFVTRYEPTADQRKILEKHRPLVTAVSFSQFQSLLVDVKGYLAVRDNYYFGSVRDPATGGRNPTVEFIDVMLSRLGTEELATPQDLLGRVAGGGRIAVLGDFGAGKSMTLRHLYHELRKAYLRTESPRFPVFVNLRDHYGQTDPAELLERHARTIGFPSPSHLVRAWRAGYVHLLLDGFDELTTLSIQGLWTKLRDNRYRAMEAVRRLVREHPEGPGLAIAGRAHFFDSASERRTALALTDQHFEYSLAEFNDEQITEYLRRSGLAGVVPPWLPSRPLLVGYLAAKGLLPDLLAGKEAEPAAGWDLLLENIASRESEIEAGIDAGTVRRILERLATKARSTPGGLGPLAPDGVIAAFREVCGYNPDERGMVLLQRLPGLGIDRQEEGSRAFIDEDFADACRAGDLIHYIAAPFGVESDALASVECAMGSLGVSVAARRSSALRFTAGQIDAAIVRAVDLSRGNVAADLARIGIERGDTLESSFAIRGVYIPELGFSASSGSAHRLEFAECFFGRIEIDSDVEESSLPRFTECFIQEIDGRISQTDLPSVFDEKCICESFASPGTTTDAVLSLAIPLGTRVVITILKKLYQRRGAGRKENALFRGLDHHAQRLVPDALRLIQREGLAAPSKRGQDSIWLPDRSQLRRVGQILAAPNSHDDPVLLASAELH
jgi:hypothetical protein